jgi:hypothetical protein
MRWWAGYLVILTVVAWPLLRAPGELLPLGGPVPGWLAGDGDPWNFLWRIDWLWRHPASILDAAPRTAELFHPFGVELTMLRGMALQGLLAIGLRPLDNPVLAHNVIWALSLLLTALATALLARAVSGSGAGAFVAGTLVAFGPHFYVHSLQHAYKYVAFALVPLALLGLWRYLESGRHRDLTLLAGAAAGIVLSDWYNALYVSLAGMVLVAAAAGTVEGRALTRRVATLGLLTLPVAAALFWSLAPVIGSRASTLVAPLEEQAAFSVDLVNLVLPPTTHAFWGEAVVDRWAGLPGNEFEKTAFLGWVLPLVLAVLAWRDRRHRQLRIWGAMAALFLILALGPWLQWEGQRLLRLPGYWLGQLPGLAGSRAPGRYMLMSHLAVAVSLAIVVGRRPRPSRAAALLLLVMALELAPFATPTVPVRRSPALAALAKESQGVVLDVPYRTHSGLYTAFQTWHRRPLVGGYLIRVRRTYEGYPRGLAGFSLFEDPLEAPMPARPELLHRAVSHLLGVRWIVLHKALLETADEAVGRLVAAGLPLEVWQEDADRIVLRLGAAPPPSIEAAWRFGDPRSTASILGLGWDEDRGGHLWGREAPRLALDVPPGARTVSLEILSFRANTTGKPDQLQLANVEDPISRTLFPGWQEMELPVPTKVPEPWLLSLRIDDPARPADVAPPSEDHRRLSVALRRLSWSF